MYISQSQSFVTHSITKMFSTLELTIAIYKYNSIMFMDVISSNIPFVHFYNTVCLLPYGIAVMYLS